MNDSKLGNNPMLAIENSLLAASETPLFDDVNGNFDQYLTFMMADEEYGIDILSVREIRGWESVTPIPNAADYVKGVINLRGVIIPIIDLRERFGIQEVEYGSLTVVIVMSVIVEGMERIMGLVVDAVSDVYSIDPDEVRTPPSLGDHVDTEYLQGLVTVAGKLVILLNIGELLKAGRDEGIDFNAIRSSLENLPEA